MHVIRYCDKAMGSSTNFMKFTLLSETACAVFQLRTPRWQYRRSNTKFAYDCKLILLQDHVKGNVMLYYKIKSFQFENVMVLNYKSDTVKINENRQCHSAIHNSTYLRELPGYGDMLTYYFLEGNIREQTHKIIGQWCKDLSSFTRTFFTHKCNTRVLSKSHNSSLLSYYAVAERPAKLRVDYLDRFGTVSARLRAWGASWTALKVRFTCQVSASRGRLDNICEFSKLSLCKIIKKTNRKSVLKLVHDTSKQSKTNCHLGTLQIKLTFRGTCEDIPRDSTVTKITIDLWSYMFQNNAYYIYLPLDHFVLKPILSYVPPHAQNVADYNVCDNTDVYDKWHESHIPISGFNVP